MPTLTIKDEAVIPSGNVTSFNKFLDGLSVDTDITLTYTSAAISGSTNQRYNYTLSYIPATGIEQERHLHNADKDIHDAARRYNGY